MKSLAKLRKGVYPRPVYEAHFSDNTYVRLSFWSPGGKPLNADRARDLVRRLTAWSPDGCERCATYDFGNQYRGGAGTCIKAPYVPVRRGPLTGKRLVRGYVEHDLPGQPWMRFLDPHFTPHAVVDTPKRRQTVRQVKAALADLVAYLDGDGPDDALARARDLLAA